MKYLLICLFLIPVACFSQSKKDSKIIVKVSDTVGLLKKISAVFYEKGYTLDNKDEMFVSTKEKTIKAGFPTVVKLRAFIKDGSITFSGEYKIDMNFMGQPPSWDNITFIGMKNSVTKLAWEEMDGIAKQLGSVSYSR